MCCPPPSSTVEDSGLPRCHWTRRHLVIRSCCRCRLRTCTWSWSQAGAKGWAPGLGLPREWAGSRGVQQLVAGIQIDNQTAIDIYDRCGYRATALPPQTYSRD